LFMTGGAKVFRDAARRLFDIGRSPADLDDGLQH